MADAEKVARRYLDEWQAALVAERRRAGALRVVIEGLEQLYPDLARSEADPPS